MPQQNPVGNCITESAQQSRLWTARSPAPQVDGGAVFHVPADAPPVTVVNFQNGVGGGVAKGDLARKKIVEGEADAREELPDLHEAFARGCGSQLSGLRLY